MPSEPNRSPVPGSEPNRSPHPGPAPDRSRSSGSAPESTDSSRPGRPRSRRAQAAILAAAADLLDEVGFDAMTMDAVATRARASKATLYRHWPGKAALAMDAFMAEVDPAVPFPDTGSAARDLRDQVRATAALFAGGRVRNILVGVLVAMPGDPELQDAFRRRYLEPRRAQGRVTIQRGIARGQLRAELDSERLFDALYGALYFRLLTGSPLSDEIADALVDQALRGVLAD